jgi:hypothetical protein
MAMIHCSECGKEISDQAKACVHCGCPLSVTFKIIKCPKCGFERNPGDTECVKCGILYEKYEAYLIKEQMAKKKAETKAKAEELTKQEIKKKRQERSEQKPEKPKTKPATVGCAVIFLLIIAIVTVGVMVEGDSTKREKSSQSSSNTGKYTMYKCTDKNGKITFLTSPKSGVDCVPLPGSIRKTDKKKARRPAKSRPSQSSSTKVVNSAWDSSVRQVERYLKKNLKDPKSFDAIEWSPVASRSDGGYQVRCKYRAKNSFGGYIMANQIFIMNSEGNVISVVNY